MIVLLENNIGGDNSAVMGDRYVKSDEKKKVLYIDATNLYGQSMCQPLLYDEIEIWHGHPDHYMNKLEEILFTPDDSDFGYFVEVDLSYPDNIKEKTKNFPFCPETELIQKDEYNDYMKKIKQKNYTQAKKLIGNWTAKKNLYFIMGWWNFIKDTVW